MSGYQRHEWVANEVIDGPTLLNSFGGKVLTLNEITSDTTVGASEKVLFTATAQLDTPRVMMMLANGTVAIDDATGVHQGYWKYGAPNNPSPGAFQTAFTWRGYTDAGGTPRLSGDLTVASLTVNTVLPGAHTFQLSGANIGSGGINCRILAGFQFALIDLGSG